MSIILGIETSCDETAAAVVKDGRKVLSNVISSQIELHKKFGGVVPEIASRKHVELIVPVIDSAMEQSGVTLDDIDAIGVTYGPGLVGALLVGVSTAKAIAYAKGLPIVSVNHIAGHIAANYLQHDKLVPPFICLVVSGGHTNILVVKDYCEFEMIGTTRDDAAGEAFDKVSRALGLEYPGGPLIDKISKMGDPDSIKFPRVTFQDSLDFSFSGLKTAVLNYINGCKLKGMEYNVNDVAASFQKAVADVLVRNVLMAAEIKNIKNIAVAGGVAANSLLRKELSDNANAKGYKVFLPSVELCTDNAAMIASAAFYEYSAGHTAKLDLNAVSNVEL